MALYEFKFTKLKRKNSLQVGDYVYYVEAPANLHGAIASTDPVYLGNVLSIEMLSDSFKIQVEVTIPNFIPDTSHFIMFAKNIQANESSLKGYYAEVTMENTSGKRAELFAISSEVMPSSK